MKLDDLLTLEGIQIAAQRIQGHIIHTPMLESPVINAQLGGRVLFKAEVLQHTGSFKFRGASHFISQLSQTERQKGVVAYSSGNHAQAVAAAAQAQHIKATIVMPEDAPQLKIKGTRFYGAKVLLYNRHTESREAIAQNIVAETGATLIPPYDHPFTIMGQGTAGLEIAQYCQLNQISPHTVLVPCSGGGLTAGCAIAIRALLPQAQVMAVEPQGFDDTAQSLAAGRRIQIQPGSSSLCDALMMLQPGELTFPINQRLLSGAFAVPDEAVLSAMKLLFLHLKLVVEAGGAVGLGALLSNPALAKERTTVVILSGGNVDESVFQQALKS